MQTTPTAYETGVGTTGTAGTTGYETTGTKGYETGAGYEAGTTGTTYQTTTTTTAAAEGPTCGQEHFTKIEDRPQVIERKVGSISATANASFYLNCNPCFFVLVETEYNSLSLPPLLILLTFCRNISRSTALLKRSLW